MLRSSGEQVSLVQLLILPNIWPTTWDFVIVLIANVLLLLLLFCGARFKGSQNN